MILEEALANQQGLHRSKPQFSSVCSTLCEPMDSIILRLSCLQKKIAPNLSLRGLDLTLMYWRPKLDKYQALIIIKWMC